MIYLENFYLTLALLTRNSLINCLLPVLNSSSSTVGTDVIGTRISQNRLQKKFEKFIIHYTSDRALPVVDNFERTGDKFILPENGFLSKGRIS